MTAPAIDATSSSLNFNGVATTLTWSHVVGASATALFVIIPYWSTSVSVGNVTGVTWNGVSMTLVDTSGRDTNSDVVEIYAILTAGNTGTHNIVASFQSNANDGSAYAVSFNTTATTSGLGNLWADVTKLTAGTGANSSVSVPNNTSNDALIDGMCIGATASPAMGAQTNRTQISTSSSGNGNGEGASYLRPGPSGAQTMNWTFASTFHAQLAVRVLGSAAAFNPATVPWAVPLTETVQSGLVEF